MKLVNEERVTTSGHNKTFRSFGFIEDDEAAIAAYSIHMSHSDRPVSIVIIFGEWGDYSKGVDGRIAIFADFHFGLEYGFVFSDPSEEQVLTSRILASKALQRIEVINSKDVDKYKEILDIIYVEELKTIAI